MKNQVLSIEQMQHLQELGVDTSKASMMYHFWVGKKYKYKNCFLLSADIATPYDSENVPTFTLQDMLEMMPNSIEGGGYVFFPTFKRTLANWMGGYCNSTYGLQISVFLHTDLLTCAYETLCWCAENGYLKGGNK